MKRRLLAVPAMLVAVCIAAPAARGATLEEVKKAIHDKVSKYKTIQYKTHMTVDMKNPQMSMKSTTDATTECMREGEKILYRNEMKSDSATKFGDMEQKNKTNLVQVADGEFLWTDSDTDGTKSITKDKIDPKVMNNPFDQLAVFKMMEEHYNLKVLPDETVNGKSCYVIEMTPKMPNPMAGKTMSYFDKGTGINLKAVGFDGAGKEASVMTTSDVKVDSSIDRKRFTYSPPAGAKVEDRTKETAPKTGM